MQANLNNTTSPPLSARPEPTAGRGAAAPVSRTAHWWRAFAGAWQADWRERRRDWRVGLVLALALALALTAAVVSALALVETLQAREQAQQAERARWLNQGQKYPHSAAHYGVYVFKPLAALSALDPGVERYVGSSVWLEAHKQNDFVHRPAADQAGISRQFALSPAFVLQVLAPLAIVFLGFGAFAREREQGLMGTLRLSGAPLSAVASARGAVLMVLSALLALPAVAAVLAVQAMQAGAAGSGPFVDGAARAVLMAAGTAAYLAVWSALTIGVSAASASMRGSLAALLALWAATALVLPRLATELAQAAAPLPSMQAFREDLDRALGEPHDAAEEARLKQALLTQYGVDDVSKLPVNWAGISLQRSEEHGDEIFDAHYGRLFAAMQRQSDATAWAGLLSPTVAMAGLSAATAASDTAQHLQFVNAAERQRRLIQKTMNDAIAVTKGGSRIDADERLWQKVPPFDFRFAPLGTTEVLRHAAPLLWALFASVVFCAVALRRLGRGALR